MSTFIFLVQFIPTLLTLVKAVEEAVPLPKQGKAKADLVLGLIGDIYATEQSIAKTLSKDQVTTTAMALVNRIVATFNGLGVFKKSA